MTGSYNHKRGSEGNSGDGDPFIVVCTIGCCPGCQDCYGHSIGCHQQPCRCDKPCTCRYPDEETDPGWRDRCERHDSSEDQRRYLEPADEDYPPEDDDIGATSPCPECGAPGCCAYDDQGRPLIHATNRDDEEGE